MDFETDLKFRGILATITASGELVYAYQAQAVTDRIEKACERSVFRLALVVPDLVLSNTEGMKIFSLAASKAGPDLTVYLVGATPSILDAIDLAGYKDKFEYLFSPDQL